MKSTRSVFWIKCRLKDPVRRGKCPSENSVMNDRPWLEFTNCPSNFMLINTWRTQWSHHLYLDKKKKKSHANGAHTNCIISTSSTFMGCKMFYFVQSEHNLTDVWAPPKFREGQTFTAVVTYSCSIHSPIPRPITNPPPSNPCLINVQSCLLICQAHSELSSTRSSFYPECRRDGFHYFYGWPLLISIHRRHHHLWLLLTQGTEYQEAASLHRHFYKGKFQFLTF